MGRPTCCGKLAVGVLSDMPPFLGRRSRRGPGCTAGLGGRARLDDLACDIASAHELLCRRSPVFATQLLRPSSALHGFDCHLRTTPLCAAQCHAFPTPSAALGSTAPQLYP